MGFQRDARTPDKAVDGDRRQDVYANTCFHPAIPPSPPSPPSPWIADLGRVYRLHDVRIYNRKGYVSRIRGATINLHNSNSTTGVTCYTFPSDTQESDGVYDVTCDGLGMYLTISHDHQTLNLCEVEVYVCSNGSYGTHCDEFCSGCLNDTCDPVSGICPGGCRRGRQGPTCAECRDGRYGIYCDQFCNSRNCITTSSSCDVTGACTDGCRDGWMNTDCRQPCKDGTYWPDCSRCRHCDVTCDVMDGRCSGKCLDGFAGVRCHVETRTQLWSRLLMWSVFGVGIVLNMLFMLIYALWRFLRISDHEYEAVLRRDVFVNDQSTEGSQQAESDAGVTNKNKVYSCLDYYFNRLKDVTAFSGSSIKDQENKNLEFLDF